MGFGGHFVLLDDPTPLDAITSKSIRDDANRKVNYIAGTRTRSSQIPGRLVTQQRVDPDDATGNILRNDIKNRWVHLWIPEIYDKYRVCTTVSLDESNKPWADPRTKDGERLDHTWRTEEFLYISQAGLNKHMIEAQYQQNPLLSEGNMIDPAWFQYWQESWYPEFEYVLQSWDTALTDTEKSAFNACTTWGVFKDKYETSHVMLLDLFSKRMLFPELRKAAIKLDRKWQPDEIVVESKVSGFSLRQFLQADGLPVTGFNPNKYGSKEERCSAISGFIEAGYVWVLTKSPDYKLPNKHAEHLMYCAQYFPKGDPNSDILDIIDSMSQALAKLAARCLLTNRNRIVEEENAIRFIKPSGPECDIERYEFDD
jgi:phage terminase large subunit-like protein